ncbi:MAG: hypothetical protein EOS38_32725 [Mesorhizobium sp.]|nr:hypothetical protein EOA38_15365 [Mesorhizobium sp. M1E.F.Ca.ET.041.01.1.1]RWD78891.1 MAG: hypothetical protein EOS38_32725 [Mesorhizobium sp.]RWD81102.1 MAG: hypothetical protein EOS39_31130 [Mesorhizobium sp.]TIV46843.1 MAG: hypothetical protein E5V88_32050 [Mesorhizobium sp.]
MRGAPAWPTRSSKATIANVSLRWSTPHPSCRFAAIHLPPQGGKGSPAMSLLRLLFARRQAMLTKPCWR